MRYSEAIHRTKRFKTRVMDVGGVKVGGDNPIRIQSMTTSNTRDVDATVQQIMRLADYGCEIARVTVQGKKEAESCEHIKNQLVQKGYTIPLVADIHFYPPAAMLVADFVDKVRVNPGNYVDRRATFKAIEYNDESYAKEIDRIFEGFSPLVEKCKSRQIAMRIGTNHGSLSDRIMNRYGDTPQGMVESALEFARVCRELDYHNFCFSMKASNPLVMMQAYRLLASEMMKLGWNYPLHLGVTEAGNGEDGRVKSAVGTGGLLLDGLGDTIRVSLTEDPWFEIDPCNRLVKLFEKYEKLPGVLPFEEKHRNIAEITKREVEYREGLPLHPDGTVILPVSEKDLLESDFFTVLGAKVTLGQPEKTHGTVDAVLLNEEVTDAKAEQVLRRLENAGIGVIAKHREGAFSLGILQDDAKKKDFCIVDATDIDAYKEILEQDIGCILLKLSGDKYHSARFFFEWIRENSSKTPVILMSDFDVEEEDLVIHASAELGAILSDGGGEGIILDGGYQRDTLRSLSFSILQAARMRSSKTEFIACPGCGRTLFDLQSVTERIRSKTAHLPGVKIAIMGCIVNGPGEMADADFGYVGSRPQKIDLYVGKECVERNIDYDDADRRLIELIKSHGKWVEPEISEEVEAGCLL